MSISDCIAALEAAGTLAVAAAAIWGDWIRSKLLPPKLRVELLDPLGEFVIQTRRTTLAGGAPGREGRIALLPS
jgi:hypothetical protein